MSVLIEVCRVLLIEDVTILTRIDLKSFDAHFCEFWVALVIDDFLGFSSHFFGPLVVADLSVDGFGQGVLLSWLDLWR